MSNFEVNFYTLPDGSKPVENFLDGLTDIKLKAKVLHDMELLEMFGNELRQPQSKYLTDGIFELRTKQSSNIARCFYFFQHGRQIIVTHGIIKKQDRTPPAELSRAIQYKQDWERRNR